jgi:hypothetical protein
MLNCLRTAAVAAVALSALAGQAIHHLEHAFPAGDSARRCTCAHAHAVFGSTSVQGDQHPQRGGHGRQDSGGGHDSKTCQICTLYVQQAAATDVCLPLHHMPLEYRQNLLNSSIEVLWPCSHTAARGPPCV